MKFIELKELNSFPQLINARKIFRFSGTSDYTLVYLVDGTILKVTDTIEDIKQKLL